MLLQRTMVLENINNIVYSVYIYIYVFWLACRPDRDVLVDWAIGYNVGCNAVQPRRKS